MTAQNDLKSHRSNTFVCTYNLTCNLTCNLYPTKTTQDPMNVVEENVIFL